MTAPFADRLRVDLGVPLAPLTTLELGGAARLFVEATDEAMVRDAVLLCRDRAMPWFVLGGGSNVVVADRGFGGLVVRMSTRGIAMRRDGDRILCTVQAGEIWDDLVARTVAEGLAGLECLSGIPGRVGATPIQNVGAYGQEVSDTIVSVRTIDRRTIEIAERPAAECAFGYRESVFKRDPTARHVVLAVTYALRPGGRPTLRHAELQKAVAERTGKTLSLDEARTVVLDARRQKSMVIDATDPNRRSAGSFFTNPIVTPEVRDRVVERALAAGVARDAREVPQHPGPEGTIKLAAAWLIERAGFRKGERHGAFGISTRHSLALVHHGGGSANDLLALAERIRHGVEERFGMRLELEPVCVGFDTPSD